MFTGIVESMGEINSIVAEKSNKHFQIKSPISHELRVDQSVSHDGVCLTVTKVEGDAHWVTAIDETLKRSSLGLRKPFDWVNLERCMKADGRFDGHIVQGHVDKTAQCTLVVDQNGSYLFRFGFEAGEKGLVVEKGSVCVNGVSLTCFNVSSNSFDVAIIPYTWEHTNFKSITPGQIVNLEFDIVGKYVQAMLSRNQK